MLKGTIVKSVVEISPDEDSDLVPSIPVGTEGSVIGNSDGMIIVDFSYEGKSVCFPVAKSEIEVIRVQEPHCVSGTIFELRSSMAGSVGNTPVGIFTFSNKDSGNITVMLEKGGIERFIEDAKFLLQETLLKDVRTNRVKLEDLED